MTTEKPLEVTILSTDTEEEIREKLTAILATFPKEERRRILEWAQLVLVPELPAPR